MNISTILNIMQYFNIMKLRSERLGALKHALAMKGPGQGLSLPEKEMTDQHSNGFVPCSRVSQSLISSHLETNYPLHSTL